MGFERQDSASDHTGRRGVSVDAHYDLLRSAGYSREKARDWAERATDVLIKSKDEEGNARPVRTSEHRRARFRVRFAWEPPEAGLSLDQAAEPRR